jgi:glycogen debranching enzyme
VTPQEIFELIIKADEKLKYSTTGKQDVRAAQARELLERARDEARAIGNDALVAQAEQRLSDLDHPPIGEDAGDDPPPIAGGSGEPANPYGGSGAVPTMAERRPTPLDPYPEERPAEETGDEKQLPPELGPEAIAILEGRTFMFSNATGDVPRGSVGGLLHDDTRFVSKWALTIDGRPLQLLKSKVVDYYSAAFFLANPELDGIRANSLAVRRFRFVGGGIHEQIAVYNSTPGPVRFRMRLEAGADFADLFEVKSKVRDRGDVIDTEHDRHERLLHFHYEVPKFLAETNITVTRSRVVRGIEGVGEGVDAPVDVERDGFVWDLELPSRHTLLALVRVTVRLNEDVLEPMHEEFGEQHRDAEGALTGWLDEAPRFRGSHALVRAVLDQSVLDLAALRIVGEVDGVPYVLPAAGLPWFMTLFGRDTIITAYQTLWVGPQLARGALHVLGELQGSRVDDFRDEEPGKILHELRSGELTVTGVKPHSPYFGTADATPLWLVLMSEFWRHSGEDEFVRARWDKVRAALEWCDRFGDRDGDGFIEYETQSSQGLGNQCWKDSWDGIQFSDATIPFLPIATCEIQGYVYDAKLRAAELAERVAGDVGLAARLRKEAEALFDRFNDVFWSDERGYYVVGLDGDKRPIDTATSNVGHLLWSGIVPDERASRVRDLLMSAAMFSGWGVRTLSQDSAGFNPIGYHTGTVWPHDNAIVASGLASYGYRDDANRIAVAQFEAARHSEYRLPEAFAGFERSLGRFPVPYPTACSPQAWATGAPFMLLKAMLGLEASGGEVHIDPALPDALGEVFVHGLHAFGKRFDVRAKGTGGTVERTS